MKPNQTPGDHVAVNVNLQGPGWSLDAAVPAPAGPTRLRQMLPLIQALTDAAVSATVQAAAEAGEEISCRKGCGACCRQMVPVTEVEAHHLRAVLAAMPQPRRSELWDRFAVARRQLQKAGLLR